MLFEEYRTGEIAKACIYRPIVLTMSYEVGIMHDEVFD